MVLAAPRNDDEREPLKSGHRKLCEAQRLSKLYEVLFIPWAALLCTLKQAVFLI